MECFIGHPRTMSAILGCRRRICNLSPTAIDRGTGAGRASPGRIEVWRWSGGAGCCYIEACHPGRIMTTADGRASFATRARREVQLWSAVVTGRYVTCSLSRKISMVCVGPGPIRLDMGGVQRMDTGGAWVLQRPLMLLESSGHEVELHARHRGLPACCSW